MIDDIFKRWSEAESFYYSIVGIIFIYYDVDIFLCWSEAKALLINFF